MIRDFFVNVRESSAGNRVRWWKESHQLRRRRGRSALSTCLLVSYQPCLQQLQGLSYASGHRFQQLQAAKQKSRRSTKDRPLNHPFPSFPHQPPPFRTNSTPRTSKPPSPPSRWLAWYSSVRSPFLRRSKAHAGYRCPDGDWACEGGGGAEEEGIGAAWKGVGGGAGGGEEVVMRGGWWRKGRGLGECVVAWRMGES